MTVNVLTVGELVAFMRVSREKVYGLAARGELRGRKIRRIRSFPEEPIQQDGHGESVVERVSRTALGGDPSAAESGDDEIRPKAPDENRVYLEVADNAVGIPPENLTKIFGRRCFMETHGRGSDRDGATLAAQELSGSLTARSKGLGQTATFTLEQLLQVRGKSDVRSAN